MDLAASDAYIVAETINSFWDQSTVTCLETETGKTNWELTFVNTRPKSMVLAGNEYLYVLLSSADPERVASLSAVNIANGKIVWQQTFEISPLIYPSSQGSPPGLQTNYSRLKIADGKLLLLNAERSGERYANMLYVYEGAPPESSRGTFVYGRVIDADTMAVLLGISVEALQGGVVRGRAVTDAAGGFRMDGLAPGIYDLRASGINYSDSTEMALNIRGDDSLTVNFNLRSERRITQLASGLAGPGPLTVQGENIFLIENVIASETDFREVRVKRVPKAGGVATKLWAGGGDGGNAIRSDEVAGYFSIGSGVIYQIPLLGSATVRFVSANQPRDLQIDDGFIYWAESNGGPTDTTGIRRISKQGGSVSTLSTKGFEYALALDADSVYFGALEGRFISDPCRVTLMRSAKDGRSPLALWTGEFPNFLSANSINTIAVADGRVYWGGSKGGIRVTPTTGGTTSALVEGTSQISNLVIDDGRLFWIETDEAGSRWIKSIDIGTGKQELVATGQFNNFTLDGDFLYATTGKAWLTNGMLLKIAKKVGIRSTVLSGRVTEQPSGNPVAGAVVQVMQDGQIRRGKTTDESGAFRFADTAPGVYTLKTFKDGFISAIKSPVDLQAGENRELNFSLQVISTVPIDNKREVVIKREDGKNRSGVLGITIPTVPQKSYVLEYKDSLFDPFWRFLQSFLGEEALTTFLDTQANSVQRFYRFRIENINSVKFDYPLGPPYFSLGASLSPLRDNDGWYVEQDFGVANADAGGKRHLGEDWNSERGPNDDLNKPVFAAASGTVIYAESPAATWNGLIVIQHVAPQGKTFLLPSGETATEVWTAYGHLDPVRVEEWVDTGQRRSVVRNQQIGVIGPPPQGSSGPHLHFEVRTKNPTGIAGPGYSLDVSGWVDPSEFIELNRNER
jgi:murein DD-endopeptidase MepM/ murein hydrolase activator NlpD